MTDSPSSALPTAGLGRRFAAMVYDGLLLMALWFVTAGIVAPLYLALGLPAETISGVTRPDPAFLQRVLLPLLWLETAAFYAWFWRHGGQTLGMRSWRLKLVHVDGGPVSRQQCLTRALVGTLSLLAALAGFLWLLIDTRGTWHDRASATRVVLLPRA